MGLLSYGYKASKTPAGKKVVEKVKNFFKPKGKVSPTIKSVKPASGSLTKRRKDTEEVMKIRTRHGTAPTKKTSDTIKKISKLNDDIDKTRVRKMGGGMMGRRFGMKKGSKFPDLTGDGKVTQADILKGRGVFSKGGGADTGKLGELKSKLGVIQNKIKRKTERLKKLKSARESLTGKRGVDI